MNGMAASRGGMNGMTRGEKAERYMQKTERYSPKTERYLAKTVRWTKQ